MIDPSSKNERMQLSRSLDRSYQELRKFNRLRQVTIRAYLGISEETLNAEWSPHSTKRDKRYLPKGNLLQVSGLSHQIALAYGEPRASVKAILPEDAGTAMTLGPALNRMANLLNLGEVHRNVAADSYFGYGIYKVAAGFLPPAAQAATGLEIGPNVWRVGQNNFIYDITADSWDKVGYVGDIYPMAVKTAKMLYPEAADRLTSFMDGDRMDAPTVFPRRSRFDTPEESLWLMDIHFPESKVVGTWPVRADSFTTIADEPLILREYNGHWSGVYQVLTHLYSPDELVPVAQAESVKSIHFLFNQLLELTSDQAVNAKINPLFHVGGQKDMERIWKAKDRYPVSITGAANVPQLFEIPGPTQSQQVHMSSLYNFFKQFTPTVDEPARAPTATQGQLERETTNGIVAEARRKDSRALQLVYYKLGHLMLNTPGLVLRDSQPLRPGSSIPLELTFRSDNPTNVRIDDLKIEPASTVFRSPETKVQQLVQSSQIVTQAMLMAAQGAPINVEKVIDTLAEYQDLPELKEWYEPADPLAQVRRTASEQSIPRIGAGQYEHRSVSERTTPGALEQLLTQQPSDSSNRNGEDA